MPLRALRKLSRSWGELSIIYVLALALASLPLPAARGVEHGVSFTGDLVYALPAYGQTVPVDSNVIARLVYESTTPANYNLGSCDCATYRQRIYNGLSVSFGPLVLRADEYDVHVINNFGANGADFIRIVFSSLQNPPFETQLAVNDAPQATGQIVISLKDTTGMAIQGSALPDPAVLSGFQTYEALLTESPHPPPATSVINIAAMLSPPAPLALTIGDFDFDLDVDGADFLVWQREVGATAPSPADATRNAIVDATDLALWQQHFGEAPGSSAAAISIAEPATVALATPFFALGMIVRRVFGRPAHDRR